jgi:LysR family transcriptional activator of nhaA
VGRRLVLTETGQLALTYAQEIFSIGSELEAAVRKKLTEGRTLEFRVGVADAVPKAIAYRLVEPALAVKEPVRIVCREWKLDSLLAALALHKLDLVIADAPLPPSVSVRAFSHRLGASRISVFAAKSVRPRRAQPFPRCLDGAPLLMPGEDSSSGQRIRTWLRSQDLRPRIIGEFDDSALAQEFGRRGAGYFFGPEVLRREIEARLAVEMVGVAEGIEEEFFAISVERRITHPCVVAITGTARNELFPSSRASGQPRAKSRVRKRASHG